MISYYHIQHMAMLIHCIRQTGGTFIEQHSTTVNAYGYKAKLKSTIGTGTSTDKA